MTCGRPSTHRLSLLRHLCSRRSHGSCICKVFAEAVALFLFFPLLLHLYPAVTCLTLGFLLKVTVEVIGCLSSSCSVSLSFALSFYFFSISSLFFSSFTFFLSFLFFFISFVRLLLFLLLSLFPCPTNLFSDVSLPFLFLPFLNLGHILFLPLLQHPFLLFAIPLPSSSHHSLLPSIPPSFDPSGGGGDPACKRQVYVPSRWLTAG